MSIGELAAKTFTGGRFGVAAGTVSRALTDIALPPQCLACDCLVAEQGGLCPTCWSRLRLIERPYCETLGTPFDFDVGEGAESAEAIAEPPPFRRCRTAAAFDDVARRLIHNLKYRDRLDLAKWMGVWMRRAGADLIADADVIVPVPIHRGRLWSRRFNQSAYLAHAVATQAGKPVAMDALCRVRSTRQQVGLSVKERERNVSGAFKVSKNQKVTVFDRSILLVDDVYTTGATVKAATRALSRAGAGAVDVLVFARVVRGIN